MQLRPVHLALHTNTTYYIRPYTTPPLNNTSITLHITYYIQQHAGCNTPHLCCHLTNNIENIDRTACSTVVCPDSLFDFSTIQIAYLLTYSLQSVGRCPASPGDQPPPGISFPWGPASPGDQSHNLAHGSLGKHESVFQLACRSVQPLEHSSSL